MTEVHVINHTHWDREWFLTHEYTTAWVPPLIDSLEDLAAANPDYEFLLDGQTLAIEDLLNTRPEYLERVRALISHGQLEIGPCYSQPDWRMVSGELHLRNLRAGIRDAQALGGDPQVAWLVDTFGHISQAPQMLTLAGLTGAYVWRGVPQMVPVFRWRGPDGTELPTIDLFGGYRNLYGITKTPDIAVDRLVAESDKLAGAYGGLPVPLFDGYDLDTEPEDPASYYARHSLPEHITLHASSPAKYAAAVASHAATAPVLEGELISGKYGSTFPGSLSARTYLKVLHHDAETALHRRLEPLAVLASALGHRYDAERFDKADRELLQNGVHDCLCGVSIDQVHERMERSYRLMLEWSDTEQSALASRVLAGFASGTYAVSTNAISARSVVRAGTQAVVVDAGGIGVSAVSAAHDITRVNELLERFEWENDHYRCVVDGNGISVDDVGRIARLVVRRDTGDTYSSEPGELLGELKMVDTLVHVDTSAIDTTIRSTWVLEHVDGHVSSVVDVRFNDGPVIEFDIELDTTGTGFRVDVEFETAVSAPTVHAGMPFDLVERSHEDTDLLTHEIDSSLAAILMGQRETEYVTEYPFHNLVALTDETATRAVFAKGLRSYRSTADGVISVALRRSVEWLALTDLKFRSGDAGPAMYVPGARSERVVEHRLAFAVLEGTLQTSDLVAHNEAFQNPPLVAAVTDGSPDAATEWHILGADVPVSSLTLANGDPTVRLYNPVGEACELPAKFERRTLWGDADGHTSFVLPNEIATFHLPIEAPQQLAENGQALVQVLTPMRSRVGASRSRPEPGVLDELRQRIDHLTAELATVEADLVAATGNDRYRLVHREYVLDRERLELQLSLELNERRSATDDEVSIPDDPDPVIAEIGQRLNDLRVKRRIYDYVVQALPA